MDTLYNITLLLFRGTFIMQTSTNDHFLIIHLKDHFYGTIPNCAFLSSNYNLSSWIPWGFILPINWTSFGQSLSLYLTYNYSPLFSRESRKQQNILIFETATIFLCACFRIPTRKQKTQHKIFNKCKPV